MPLLHVSGPPLAQHARPGLVRLLCGVAGSGKTTFARSLVSLGFVRLSIDDWIWRSAGRYGVDYPAQEYPRHQERAERAVRLELERLCRSRAAVVVDLSFWRRADRDRYRGLVRTHGGEVELVYLDVPEAVLRRRLRERAERFDADAAFPVDDGMLERFRAGFEVPSGEGETVLRWEQP